MCTPRKHEKQQNSNTGKGGIECAQYACTLSKKVGAFFSNLTINLMSFTVDKYATHTHTHKKPLQLDIPKFVSLSTRYE